MSLISYSFDRTSIATYGSFSAWCTAMGASTVGVRIMEDISITDDLDMSSVCPNVTVGFGLATGSFTIASGKTLTINRMDPGAPLRQLFAGAGTVVFANGACDECHPEWWGAVANGSTVCTSAIQAAINCGPPVRFSKGVYLSGQINMNRWHINLYGTGAALDGSPSSTNSTTIKATGTLTNLLYCNTCYVSTVNNIAFDGSDSTESVVTLDGPVGHIIFNCCTIEGATPLATSNTARLLSLGVSGNNLQVDFCEFNSCHIRQGYTFSERCKTAIYSNNSNTLFNTIRNSLIRGAESLVRIQGGGIILDTCDFNYWDTDAIKMIGNGQLVCCRGYSEYPDGQSFFNHSGLLYSNDGQGIIFDENMLNQSTGQTINVSPEIRYILINNKSSGTVWIATTADPAKYHNVLFINNQITSIAGPGYPTYYVALNNFINGTVSNSYPWNGLTSTPTSLTGYGILHGISSNRIPKGNSTTELTNSNVYDNGTSVSVGAAAKGDYKTELNSVTDAMNFQLFLTNSGTYHIGFIGSTAASGPLSRSDGDAFGIVGGVEDYLSGLSKSIAVLMAANVPEFRVVAIPDLNSDAGSLGTIPFKVSRAGNGTFLGVIKTSDTTDATAADTGSLQTKGGIYAAKDVYSGANIRAATAFKVGSNQVVGARDTGWTDQTATGAKTDLGASPTVGQLASFCRSMYDALKTHGLIGT